MVNVTPKSTQPSIPVGWINRVSACLVGVKLGHVHSCQVTGNTVRSHTAGDAP